MRDRRRATRNVECSVAIIHNTLEISTKRGGKPMYLSYRQSDPQICSGADSLSDYPSCVVSCDRVRSAVMAVGTWKPALLVLGLGVLAPLYMRTYPVPVKGSVVVITGASSGIGRHAAVYLARQGFTVYAGVRNPKDMEELRSKEGLPTLQPIVLDVTKAEHIASAVGMVEDSGLPLAGIVNNAGLGYPLPIELADMDRVRDVYEVNVFGVMAMVKAFAPQLRRWKGRVVNVGSVTGTLAAQSDGVYASSKHALEGLTDALRLELGAWDISVSLIIPGQVESSMWDKNTGAKSPARGLRPEEYELYKGVFTQVDRAVASFLPTLAPPFVTSRAIHEAITSRHPRTRYAVAGLNGIPLWLLRLVVPLVPDRVLDLIKLNL